MPPGPLRAASALLLIAGPQSGCDAPNPCWKRWCGDGRTCSGSRTTYKECFLMKQTPHGCAPVFGVWPMRTCDMWGVCVRVSNLSISGEKAGEPLGLIHPGRLRELWIPLTLTEPTPGPRDGWAWSIFVLNSKLACRRSLLLFCFTKFLFYCGCQQGILFQGL